MGPLALAGPLESLFGQDSRIEAAKIGRQSEHGEAVNCPLGRIKVVPARAISVIARVGVVVIVVPLTEADKRDQPVVAAAVPGPVRLRPEHMTEGIDGKGRIEHHEHPEHSSEKKTSDPADQSAVEGAEQQGKR